jgi:oligosaccharide repeat unit polymerase
MFLPTLLATALLLLNLGVPVRSMLQVWSAVCLPTAFLVLKFDFLNPLLAFLLPWTTITLLGTMQISKYTRPLSDKTYAVLLAAEVVAVGSYYVVSSSSQRWKLRAQPQDVNRSKYRALVLFFVAFTIFNIMVAGYIPLIRGIQTGDTGYLDFGIHSVQGFYNAFANALGVLSFYLYLKSGRKRYLGICLLILVVFALFVTRQNIVSMIVESFVVYCFIRGRVALRKFVIGAVLVLVLFGLAGNLRSGEIREIAGIKEEYRNLPDAAIWGYVYSYFNILNLDNFTTNPNVPAYNGVSVFGLLPSFVRPTVANYEDSLELPEFNTSSYIALIYLDVGFWGVALFTCAVSWWGARSYRQALQENSFYAITQYSVLLFCAVFSFLINFWFYLPIIAQIPIFYGFSKHVLTKEESSTEDQQTEYSFVTGCGIRTDANGH